MTAGFRIHADRLQFIREQVEPLLEDDIKMNKTVPRTKPEARMSGFLYSLMKVFNSMF